MSSLSEREARQQVCASIEHCESFHLYSMMKMPAGSSQHNKGFQQDRINSVVRVSCGL